MNETNKPLHTSTDLYLILDDYLTHIRKKYDDILKERKKIEDVIVSLSKKLKKEEKLLNNNVDNFEHKQYLKLKNKAKDVLSYAKDIDKQYFIQTANIRNIGVFCTDLALNKIEKNNKLFDEFLNYYLETENYEMCSKLKNVIDTYFN